MSSNSFENEVRRQRARLPIASAITLLLLSLMPAPAAAGEATARGKKASIVWMDETGARHEDDARDIEFGYATRVFLKVPKDGKNFKDEVRQVKGIQFGADYIGFNTLDTIELNWSKDESTGFSRLIVKVTLANGKTREGGGTTLPGASHPKSPFFAFIVNGEARRLDILPMSTEGERAGKPRLVSIQFVL